MLIRSILTIAVLGSFVFGAAAQATEQRPENTRFDGGLAAQIDGVAPPGTPWAGR